MEEFVDLNRLLALSAPVTAPQVFELARRLPPLGQRIAIAQR